MQKGKEVFNHDKQRNFPFEDSKSLKKKKILVLPAEGEKKKKKVGFSLPGKNFIAVPPAASNSLFLWPFECIFFLKSK